MTTASSGPGIGFPQVSYLKELQQRSDLRETSFAIDFPLLTDPEVRRLSGNKGSPFGQAIHKRMFWDAANNKLLGVIYFSFECEGPVGAVHGGAIATALDSVLGYYSMFLLGWGCFTLNLNVDYHKFIPLGSTVRFECSLDRIEGKKLFIEAKLMHLVDDVVHSKAKALFYKSKPLPTYDQAMQMFGRGSNTTKEQLIEQLQRRRRESREKRKRAEQELKQQKAAAKGQVEAKL